MSLAAVGTSRWENNGVVFHIPLREVPLSGEEGRKEEGTANRQRSALAQAGPKPICSSEN